MAGYTVQDHVEDLAEVIGQLYYFIVSELDSDPAPIGDYLSNDRFKVVARSALILSGRHDYEEDGSR